MPPLHLYQFPTQRWKRPLWFLFSSIKTLVALNPLLGVSKLLCCVLLGEKKTKQICS